MECIFTLLCGIFLPRRCLMWYHSIFAPVKIVGTCLHYSSCSIPLRNLIIEVTWPRNGFSVGIRRNCRQKYENVMVALVLKSW